MTLENTGDVIVESTCVRRIEAVSSEPSHSAPSIDCTVVSSVWSDLFRGGLKSRREDLAVKLSARLHTLQEKLLTERVGWVQPQHFQCFCASVQQESHPFHIKKVHMTKADSLKQVNHVFQKANPRETCHHQPPLQWRDGGWNECQVVCWFPRNLTES